MQKLLMIFAILLPALSGVGLAFLRFEKRRTRIVSVAAVLIAEALIVTGLMFFDGEAFVLFSMTDSLKVSLQMDGISKVFMAIAAYGYLIAGVFAFKYLDEEERHGSFPESMFYAFYLLSLSALIGMDFSANFVAMYFFFELLTLLSMPLVLFEKTKESIVAAIKYLFYSIAGALLGLCLMFFLSRYAVSLDFAAGGTLDPEKVMGHEKLLRIVIFLGVVGFTAKAGMYPLHGWLPAAHPVAPAPASAVLSGVIAKAGVLASIRLIYSVAGVSFLYGSWVQIAWLSLALLTVFMGSMMAFREKVFKKRLAYSSVSQISYALFGVFLMNPAGLTGGLMQVLFHAATKIGLFLTAGSFIYYKGFHEVHELEGIGRDMPKTLTAFTLLSLSLIGIPPFAGFVSKWYLAEGSLASALPVLDWLGPVILLVSALLTAGYLLPVTVKGFFSEKKTGGGDASGDGSPLTTAPLMVLSAVVLILGCIGGPIFSALMSVIGMYF